MIITAPDVTLLRARMTAALMSRLPGHARRLSWDPAQLAAFQRDRLRELLARATQRSPFHADRLAGIDPATFELADLPRLPVMTKTQMMAGFDQVVTDRRLTRDLVDRHLAGSGADPALLLGDFVCRANEHIGRFLTHRNKPFIPEPHMLLHQIASTILVIGQHEKSSPG